METYPRAPISEAVLDIQVRTSTPLVQEVFVNLAASLSLEYPQSSVMNLSHVLVNVAQAPAESAAPSVSHSITVSGLRLLRPENDRVLMIQPRVMTFSHLPPYTNWETFQAEGRRLWESYVSFVNPEAVTRVALRYINRIDIPRTTFETSDYFQLFLEIPKSIPQDLSAFFLQLQMPQTDLSQDMTAVINFTPTGPRAPEHQTMVLDIDVFVTRELSTSVNELFDLFDIIRKRKNKIFEACITDKTRELFR